MTLDPKCVGPILMLTKASQLDEPLSCQQVKSSGALRSMSSYLK